MVGIRRFGRDWWAPGAAAVAGFAVVFSYLGPVVLDPMFNQFKPLPAGATRDDVLELARRAGVEVGEVYEVDASRRTTAANAYVTGLGHTKRVVLYDTLLKDFTPAETRLVVAHELGHVRYKDVPGGLLWLALVAPFGTLVVARATREAHARRALPRCPPWCSPRARRARADDDLQPALTRGRAPRGRVRARADAASPTRWSASSAGSRSRTSATPTRRAGSSSSSARTRRRWSGSAQALAATPRSPAGP